MTFRNARDLKFFVYLSTAKINMLHDQIGSNRTDKRSLEWKLDVKFASVARKTESSDEVTTQDKLELVVTEIEAAQQIGTVDEPNLYVKGTLPMRWGIFRDAGRPAEEPPLVYFGGYTEQTVFGFGGSTRHVIGGDGISNTGSRSLTPYLVAHLLKGLDVKPDGWYSHNWRDEANDYQTFHAIALATYQLKGPEQNMEFVAKVLLEGEVRGNHLYSDKDRKVLLATPLYVALASPYPKDVML